MYKSSDIKNLANNATFSINDEQADRFLKHIENNAELVEKYIVAANGINFEPADYPVVENCSCFSDDQPQESNEDALNNAIKADKFVLGK